MELSKMQKRIINKKPNGHFLIKGVYGSGKTSAVINKIPLLLEKYCLEKNDKILVVSADKDSCTVMHDRYECITKNKYYQSSFFDDGNNKRNRKLEFAHINGLVNSYFEMFKKSSKKNFEVAEKEECIRLLKDAIGVAKTKNKKNAIFKDECFEFIRNEISYMKNCGYNSYKKYALCDRRDRAASECGPKVLRKNSLQRKIIFDIFELYNNNLRKINKVDSDDIKAMALKYAGRKNSRRYTHVIIDNCEKLSRIELEFLHSLYNETAYSSITFLMDCNNQSYRTSWIKKSRIFESFGYTMKGRTINLKSEVEASGNLSVESNLKFLNDNEISDLCVDKNKKSAVKNLKSKGIIDNYNSHNAFGENIRFNLSYYDIDYNKDDEYEVALEEDKFDAKSITLDSESEKTVYNELGIIKYIDLKRNITHKFIKDYDYENEIYIKDDGLEEKVDDICQIPVFNEIAAGSPILINDAFQDNYILPKVWIRNEKDTFILKIKGDSMINKNIEDGDFVVIKKQNTAEIGDIVAVDIAGEATLKTYRKIYGKIALMPENEKYEPIMIGDQEFGFLGVAVGIIKNN